MSPMSPNSIIYLDHAAATPTLPLILDLMAEFSLNTFFNPSSPYLPAKQVREDLESARDAVAGVIGAKSPEIIFTAGATESINLAFTAVSPVAQPSYSPAKTPSAQSAAKSPASSAPDSSIAPKVLVLATEHESVLQCAADYPHELIKVHRSGLIDLDDFQSKLADTVELVSVSLVNNELGTIQPISEIAAIIQSERERRRAAGDDTPLFFHTDASQAFLLLDVNVARLGVDMLTINSAKIYGPKGIGALYAKHDVPLRPIIKGGGQERGLRSGTENTASIIGFTAALTHAKDGIALYRRDYAELGKLLRQGLAHTDPAPVFLGDPKHQLGTYVPVCFPGIDAERLVYKLEAQGVLVATGAACAASKGQKSHVLAAIGLSDEEIAGSLRLTLGALNGAEEIREAARIISAVVSAESARLRARH